MHGFTAYDRCDGCGAQAHHIARKSGTTELLFCNHHHNKYKDKLLAEYWLIDSDLSPAEPVPVAAYTE